MRNLFSAAQNMITRLGLPKTLTLSVGLFVGIIAVIQSGAPPNDTPQALNAPMVIYGSNYTSCSSPGTQYSWSGCFKSGTSMYAWMNINATYNVPAPGLKSGSSKIKFNYRQKDSSLPSSYAAYQVRVMFKKTDGTWGTATTLNLPAAGPTVAKNYESTINVPTDGPTQFQLQWINDTANSAGDANLQLDVVTFDQSSFLMGDIFLTGNAYSGCSSPGTQYSWSGCFNTGASTYALMNTNIIYNLPAPGLKAGSAKIKLNYQQKNNALPSNYPAYSVKLLFKYGTSWAEVANLSLPAGGPDIAKTFEATFKLPTDSPGQFQLQWNNDRADSVGDANLQINNLVFSNWLSYEQSRQVGLLAPPTQLIQVDLKSNIRTNPMPQIEKVTRRTGEVPSSVGGNSFIAEVVDTAGNLLTTTTFDMPERHFDSEVLFTGKASGLKPPPPTSSSFNLLLPWSDKAATLRVKTAADNKSTAAYVTYNLQGLAAPAPTLTKDITTLNGTDVSAAQTRTAAYSNIGSNNNILDLVIVGSGFPQGDANYRTQSLIIATYLMTFEPFKTRAAQVNVHFADIGADYGCTRPIPEVPRYIECPRAAVISDLTSRGYPIEKILIITNMPDYGGGAESVAGTIGTMAIGSGANLSDVFVHEFGHLMGLEDEYNVEGWESQPDNYGLRNNCWTGPGLATADSWSPFGILVNQPEITAGCTKANWTRSTPCSIMNLLECRYFNPVSQALVNRHMNLFTAPVDVPAVPPVESSPEPEQATGCVAIGNSLPDPTPTGGKNAIVRTFTDCVSGTKRIGNVEVHLKSYGSTLECLDRNKVTNADQTSGLYGQATFTGCPTANDGSPKTYYVSYISRAGYHVKSTSPTQVGTQFLVYGNRTPILRIVMEKDSAPELPPAPAPYALYAGQFLFPGQYLRSPNNNYTLLFQYDGNLVIYSPQRAIWQNHTYGKSSAILAMQGDGILAQYNTSWHPVWYVNSLGTGADRLYMQDDGNLVLYNAAYQPIWASNTSGQQ